MKNKISGLVSGIIAVFFLAVLALVVIDSANKSRYDLPDYGSIPHFQFIERSGIPYGKTEMEGKINIVNFFFTSCKGPCPYMNSQVAKLYRKYATSQDVQFVSISVDPQRDSLSILQNYATDFGVTDNRWLFLRGPMDEVEILSEKGFMLGGELPDLHSTKLILVDSAGHIRGYYNSYNENSLELLTIRVRELLKKM